MPKIRAEAHAPLAAALASLVVGVGLYAAVPKGDLGASPVAPIEVANGAGVAAPGAAAVGSTTGFAAGSASGGSSRPAGLISAVLGEPVGEVVPDSAGGSDVPEAPEAPEVPACPTDAATAQVDDLRRQVTDAVGRPVPGDALDDLAAIAAGCSDETPTGPVLRLALEIARLVPDTGLPTIETPVLPLPAPPTAPVPPEVVEALRPAEAVILEACGGIGMLGLLVGLVPGAANVPIYDSNAVTVAGYGAALCSQFEPPT